MIRQVKVELTRLLWRRAVVALLVLAVAGAARDPRDALVHDTRPQSIDDIAADYGSFVYRRGRATASRHPNSTT